MTLPVRVGGCLAPHWRRWQAIGAESWVVTVLRDGYRVPFLDSPPPLSRTPVSFPTYRAGSPRARALRQGIEGMLAKGALEIARDPGPGFYSRLFLVEKASGGWRPVIDLSHLNEFVQLTLFKMETVAPVLLSVREGDFLASLDLKDAYFQIPIHRSSRKLLRFTSERTVYQFQTLCFGLSTAPQVFTMVFAVVSEWAHTHGIRLLHYLDNWLVLSSSEREAKQAVQSLLSLCRTLGIVINEKSDLVPSQTAKYLGMTIDTEAGKVFPSQARVEKFLMVVESFCTMDVHLDARYLPGQDNVLADFLSRRGQIVGTEWSLHPQVARSLLHVWGNPSIGLFATCHQRETAPVLLASSGSPGRLRGCVSPSLGRPGSLHVPSLSSGRSGDRPCLRVVACRDDSGRTSLAREGVVRRPSTSADPTTSCPALVGQSASAAPLQPLPPRRPRAKPSHVATLKRHFRKSGFSGRAAGVLSGCLRSSTSRLYQSRW